MELEMKRGFKQTEIGLIPEDWDIATMRSLTTLMTNGFVGTAKSQYTEARDGVIYIQGYNVKENSFNFSGIKKVNPEFHKKNKKSDLKEGDLLTVQTGDVGLTTIVPKELEGSNCHALIISRFKSNKAYPWYYTQYFNSKQGRARLVELETGTTMKHINVGELQHWLVPLPPTLAEQKAIATALSDVDDLISSLNALIAKKKAIKQGAMQQLLTPPSKRGKRLDGFDGEWVEVRLGDVADFYKGKGLPKSEIEEDAKYPCVHYGELFTKYNEVISEIRSKTNYTENTFCSKINDVLMPTSDVTPNGLATASAIFRDDVILGGDVLVIRPDGDLLGSFLSFQISINKPQIMSLISGTTVFHLYGSDMAKFKFYKPSFDEQKAIVQILSDMDEELEELATKKEKYEHIKQGMMQELLTGKTRLV